MANKMLIDASHPEETRVVVVRGQKVEEFDFESANRRQLRGNIYLAKVTRVEPSLQAAFVEYGGNRHGFLAFSEIHPDYYQIPMADRQALLEAEAQAARDEEEEDDRRHHRRRGASKRTRRDERVSGAPHGRSAGSEDTGNDAIRDDTAPNGSAEEGDGVVPDRAESDEGSERGALSSAAPEHGSLDERTDAPAESDAPDPDQTKGLYSVLAGGDDSGTVDAERAETAGEETSDFERGEIADDETATSEVESRRIGDDEEGEHESEESDEILQEHEVVEQLGGDALEEVRDRPRVHRRQYKIQEVIKRRQILLVQVVKEERGNKGAALTTYLSLAGRYSVLMPNTGRGGGISRKITNVADRKRLKEIAQELEVPDGMGIILRTAGAARTKAEIKRDYEYLMRMWESVRELTLRSSAPALVYEEGSLIKRAIRDLYNKDIEDIIVSGDEGYREAKDFMRMLMPSHAKLVKPYREPVPLFAKHGIEAQLDAMFSNHVTLRSGGYLVINPTEALVSIDVNSGRSTREHNIEDTALKTNLEAAEEIARQLRLRDLAGLIVIDFIDMEENRNNRAVEKKLNECLKNDRARIQVGRISPFGLLEMSRQRIRTGVLESSSIPCPHCAGTGFVRATPSVALQVLRSVEETLIKSAAHNLVVRTRTEAASYILNQKRIHLRDLETRFMVQISVVPDESLTGSATYAIERGEPALKLENKAAVTGVQIDAIPFDEPEDEEEDAETEDAGDEQASFEGGEERPAEQARDEEGAGRRRRRRRRRRGRGDREQAGGVHTEGAPESDEDETEESEPETKAAAEAGEEPGEPSEAREDDRGRRRRRGRRGGRGREREEAGEPLSRAERGSAEPDEEYVTETRPSAERPVPEMPDGGPAPATTVGASLPELTSGDAPFREPAAAERREDNVVALQPGPVEEQAGAQPEAEPVAIVLTPPDPERPKRAGWWSRAKSVLSGS